MPCALFAVEDTTAKKAIESGHYKEAAVRYRELATSAPQELKGEWLCRQALAAYRDQDDITAFTSFIEAIETIKLSNQPLISKEEQALCDEASKLYLDTSGMQPREIAAKLKLQYTQIANDHPNYYMLNFYVAIACANLGFFDEFFERFYRSYKALPDCYMAIKTRGVLHLKLFERLTDPVARDKQKELALRCLTIASEKNPADSSLYKMLVLFSAPEQKNSALIHGMESIIEHSVVVSRTDVSFFVEEAVRLEQYELARRFIEKAKEWYPYSRVINAAEEILKKKRL